MPPLRMRAQKARVVDISDSSSQASEDDALPAKTDPKANRVVLHYAAENPDKPNLETDGKYGMFSQCSPLLPTSSAAPSTTSAKRKRATMDKSKMGVSKKSVMEDRSGERHESPLFEPEHGWQEDADTVMADPPLTPSSIIQLPSRKKGKGVATTLSTQDVRRNKPIFVESSSSSSDSDSDSDSDSMSEIVVSPHQDLTSNLIKDLIAISALPGDASRIDEYVETLQELATQDSKITEQDQAIEALTKEETATCLALNGLANEETQRYAAIAKACAKGIRSDMATPSIAANMSAIQAAIEKQNGEAEEARQAVPGMMAERKAELEAQVLELGNKKEALGDEYEQRTLLQCEELCKRKAELEAQGSMAMAVEFGRRLERFEDARRHR